MDLWFIGNGCEDHLPTANTSILEDNCTRWKKLMLYYAILFGNLLMSRLYIIFGPIKLVILSKIR